MADPKIVLQKGQGPFTGRVTRLANGVKDNKKWKLVGLVSVVPWMTSEGLADAGAEVVWFTPAGRDYDALVDGALVEITRKGTTGGAYEVRPATPTPEMEKVAGETSSKAARALSGEKLKDQALKIVLANALAIAQEVAEYHNGKIRTRLNAIPNITYRGGEAGEYEGPPAEANDLAGLMIYGAEIEKIAVHLLMGSDWKSMYEIPDDRMVGQPDE